MTSSKQAMGFTPVKPFYQASRTTAGVRVQVYRSIALLRSLACLLARCFWANLVRLLVFLNGAYLGKIPNFPREVFFGIDLAIIRNLFVVYSS